MVFFVVERERNRQNNDNWNFRFWVFWSKNGRFVTHICFSKNALLKPLFYSVRAFWAKLPKKRHFGHPPKMKNLTDNWKALFLVVLYFYFFSFFGFFGAVFFFGGPEGPPHLALNPPYYYLFWGVLFFPFLYLLFNAKNCFSLEKGIFCLFLSLSFVSP